MRRSVVRIRVQAFWSFGPTYKPLVIVILRQPQDPVLIFGSLWTHTREVCCLLVLLQPESPVPLRGSIVLPPIHQVSLWSQLQLLLLHSLFHDNIGRGSLQGFIAYSIQSAPALHLFHGGSSHDIASVYGISNQVLSKSICIEIDVIYQYSDFTIHVSISYDKQHTA